MSRRLGIFFLEFPVSTLHQLALIGWYIQREETGYERERERGRWEEGCGVEWGSLGFSWPWACGAELSDPLLWPDEMASLVLTTALSTFRTWKKKELSRVDMAQEDLLLLYSHRFRLKVWKMWELIADNLLQWIWHESYFLDSCACVPF